MPTRQSPPRPWVVKRTPTQRTPSPVPTIVAPNFYHTPEWRRTRKAVIEAQPLCRTCMANHRFTVAQMVDHIVPIRLGGAALDINNLQSLCHKHHNAKSAKEGAQMRQNQQGEG